MYTFINFCLTIMLQKCHIIQQYMKCDNIEFCKIHILVSTFRTFDNRDKALIGLPALLHNNIPM